jgi:hypothetical protein
VPAREAAIHTVLVAGIGRTGGGKLIVPPWCVHAGSLLTAGAAVLLGRPIVCSSSPLVACNKGATLAVALGSHRCTISVKLVQPSCCVRAADCRDCCSLKRRGLDHAESVLTAPFPSPARRAGEKKSRKRANNPVVSRSSQLPVTKRRPRPHPSRRKPCPMKPFLP